MDRNVAWTVRVRANGRDRATAFARQSSFEIGPAVHFDREFPRPTALEHVLGAIGADLVNGLAALARRRGVPLENVEAVVTGALENPLVYLGVVGEAGQPGLARLAIKVYVSSNQSEPVIRELWAEALRRSPLIQTFGSLLQLELDLAIQ